MIQDTTQQAAKPEVPAIRPGQTPMAMCPMAAMCKGMVDKRLCGLLPMLAGAVLIVVGVAMFVEPRTLVWLMGTVSMLFGIMLLAMASFIRRLGGAGPGQR